MVMVAVVLVVVAMLGGGFILLYFFSFLRWVVVEVFAIGVVVGGLVAG